MNERIRELAKQAGLIAPYGSDHEGLRDFDYRQFAELIVQECADHIMTSSDRYRKEYFADKILTHFGMKR